MPRVPSRLARFRAAYRALLTELWPQLTADITAQLLASPLAMDVVLGSLALPERLAELLGDVPAGRYDEYEEAARDVVRELMGDRFGLDAGSTVQEPSGAESPERDSLRYGEEMVLGMAPPAPPPSPAPSMPYPPPPPPPSEGTWNGADEATEPLPDEPRFLNAQIMGKAQHEPLDPGASSVLEVFVGLESAGDASARVPGAGVMFSEGEETIELTVQVTSSDFSVEQPSLPLKLPRRGPSKGKARFDITPLHAGRGTLTISLHKQGNFILQMEVSYSIGEAGAEPTSQKVSGRSISAAEQLQRRELGLTITRVTNGYECTVRGATHTSVVLPLTDAELADAVTQAREALMAVVGMRDDARALVFQKGVDIDAASQAKALAILARAGASLLRALFYGPKAGRDVNEVGDLLRKRATRRNHQLTLQVVADRFPVPWGLLYMGSDAEGQPLDWDLFLGMRHIVEVIPLQTGSLVDDTVIVSDQPGLAVSINVNEGIDAQMKTDVVARQVKYWSDGEASAAGRLGLARRTRREEVLDALRGKSADQLMYFYCHAVTNGPADPGGIKGSYLLLTNDERITVDDLDREAPMRDVLPGNPLIFINACESAELRPEFYQGFIPYFMAKGARGVVGTECKTPALFATEWALEFFPRFLGGEPLGELFLDLRRSFNEKHRNPLGLVYAVYCDGDTQVQPSLTV